MPYPEKLGTGSKDRTTKPELTGSLAGTPAEASSPTAHGLSDEQKMRLAQWLRNATVTEFDFTLEGCQQVCKPKYLLTSDRDYLILLIEADCHLAIKEHTSVLPAFKQQMIDTAACLRDWARVLDIPSGKFVNEDLRNAADLVVRLSNIGAEVISDCADFLAREYPDNANTNAFCAALRSLSAISIRERSVGDA